MSYEWSGRTTAYEHKHEGWEQRPLSVETNSGFRKVWFLDAQWSDCPVEVEAQVRAIWRLDELGNDNYIHKTSLAALRELQDEKTEVQTWDKTISKWVNGPIKTDAIVQWILEKEPTIGEKESILIHWWW